MNILFVIGKYPGYGGTEKMTTILGNEFFKLGHKVVIASFDLSAPELVSGLDHIKLIKLSYPVSARTNILILKKEIEKEGIDIIINQWCLPFNVTKMINRARKCKRVKLISVLHGVPNKSKKVIIAEDNYKNSKGIKKIVSLIKLKLTHEVIRYSCGYVYDHSDKYVLLSKSFIPTFSKYSRRKDTTKLTAIGNPISITTDYSSDYIESKKNQILYVGRLDMENKRVNRIIETWQLIADSHPDWSLHLVGEGPHRKALQDYVYINNVRNVFFHGFRPEEPTNFYRNAKILLLTSDLEGFGLVIVEAMSYAVVPIVYGSYSSIYDIIDSGKDGFITDVPFSAQITADRVEELIKNPATWRQIALQSQIKSHKFELKPTIDKWISLIRNIKHNEN